MNFLSLKIAHRLTPGFSLVLALLCIVTLVGVRDMAQLNDTNEPLVHADWTKAKIKGLTGDSVAQVVDTVTEQNAALLAAARSAWERW